MNADECIFFQLAKASQAGVKFWTQKVSALGVTAVQAMVLRFLCESERVSSKELGEKTQLDSATLTGILDRLETALLIERRPNPKDRRGIRIHLTQKGKKTAEQISSLMEEANAEYLGDLSHQDQGALKDLLKRIRTKRL
jgi:DNA-binding MarR family transcriptional regulator